MSDATVSRSEQHEELFDRRTIVANNLQSGSVNPGINRRRSLCSQRNELFSRLAGSNQNMVVCSIPYSGHANSSCLGGFPLADGYGSFALALQSL